MLLRLEETTAQPGSTGTGQPVHQELRPDRLRVGRDRVARLMLRARTMRGIRPPCNNCSKAKGDVELMQQVLSPFIPNRCWVGDIISICSTSGWRFLAVWIDLYSLRVVNWPGAHHGGADGAAPKARTGRWTAVDHNRPALVQHRSEEPIPVDGLPAAAGGPPDQLQHSAKGCCWDRAVVGNFLSTLRRERDLDEDTKAWTALENNSEIWRSGSSVALMPSVDTQ